MRMKRQSKSLSQLLDEAVVVTLPSGEKQKMSKRKAFIWRHAVAAANGNWQSLSLLLAIAQEGDVGPEVIVTHDT